MFDPIVPPPSEHHPLNTGHSTEFGDNAKTMIEKINAGFSHVYASLKGVGATLADEVEYVAKSEFDVLDSEFTNLLNSHGELSHMVTELKAELANLKMMVQGLGFAGIRPAGAMLGGPVITDPSAMHMTDGAAAVAGISVTMKPKAGPLLTFESVASSEPIVKVTES